MNIEKLKDHKLRNEFETIHRSLNAQRKDPNRPVDLGFAEFMKAAHGFESMGALFADLGIDPAFDTVQNLMTVDDFNVRWIIPEIYREALRLGLRKSAIWPNLVATEQTVSQREIKMPWINMSDATPKKVGEAETIPMGNVSYGDKSVKIGKMGRGISLTYEVAQYVSLNLVSIFFEDMGIKFGMALDAWLIDVLLNGDQADGSESAPVMGVAAPSTLAYKDLLKIYIRMSRLGRTATTVIGGEDIALDVLDLPEFKNRQNPAPPLATLALKTPVPQTTNYFIHGSVPDDQQLMVDTTAAAIKLNAQPLMIESEKMISNQTNATYATLTTGFGKLFRDASLVVDRSLNIASNGFPSFLEVDALEQATIE